MEGRPGLLHEYTHVADPVHEPTDWVVGVHDKSCCSHFMGVATVIYLTAPSSSPPPSPLGW